MKKIHKMTVRNIATSTYIKYRRKNRSKW